MTILEEENLIRRNRKTVRERKIVGREEIEKREMKEYI